MDFIYIYIYIYIYIHIQIYIYICIYIYVCVCVCVCVYVCLLVCLWIFRYHWQDIDLCSDKFQSFSKVLLTQLFLVVVLKEVVIVVTPTSSFLFNTTEIFPFVFSSFFIPQPNIPSSQLWLSKKVICRVNVQENLERQKYYNLDFI